MTRADMIKTLFDFMLVVLAVLSVVYEKRLIQFEKRLGVALRRAIRKRHEAHRPQTAIRSSAPAQQRPVTRPTPVRACPAAPTPHRVA